MRDGITPAEGPFESGDIVHISPTVDVDGRPHRYACEVEEVHSGDSLDEHTYSVRSVVQERTLRPRFGHYDLIPSPRGYENIDALLGSRHVDGERLLGKFKRPDLEKINACLSVVDPDEDPTKDWLNELEKNDVDRINSIFAELILLYHLRTAYGRDQVVMNARIDGKGSKDFDLRVLTEEDDVWIEVMKPDYAASLPDEVGFISGDKTGNSIDNKLKKKFEDARDHAPDGAVLVLAAYLEEQITQGLEISQWLDEDYYDVGEFCDGWLTYTHLTETEIGYQSFTEAGERCRTLFDRMVAE
ncbi:hypothetical protein SAMN06269185_1605 [Natronoarchaeum philippinense]|uniref:Uncharacterized protein n=1 Tax=Natronoarchaeum philippinense TaxID=558529 RepID=A0A285NXD8_NATPI|nr:hypothetical protein [Natronoarchaeum philippinense]SNZ12311.1 hypothetical protein SAMN06269185_1605 [Natronoarchaeum philippinense]